jgi:helix-turn-helix protein
LGDPEPAGIVVSGAGVSELSTGIKFLLLIVDNGRGNKACVRIEHLKLGTHHENMLDARAKDREAGKLHWNSKNKIETIDEIRRRFAAGGVTKKELADMFGIDPSHVSRIISGDRHTRLI